MCCAGDQHKPCPHGRCQNYRGPNNGPLPPRPLGPNVKPLPPQQPVGGTLFGLHIFDKYSFAKVYNIDLSVKFHIFFRSMFLVES